MLIRDAPEEDMDTTLPSFGGGPQAEEKQSKSTRLQTKASEEGRMDLDSVLEGEGEVEGEGDEYSIATHLVKVRRSGMLTDVSTLWDLVGTEAVSGNLDSLLDAKPGFDRLASINAFSRVRAEDFDLVHVHNYVHNE